MTIRAQDKTLKGKNLLIVGTGSRRKRFILKRIKELGCNLIIINNSTNWAKSYATSWIIANINDHLNCITAINSFLEINPEAQIDGLVTFCENNLLLTARIAEELNLIGIPLNTVNTIRDKFLFREFCKNNLLPTPKYILYNPQVDIEEGIKNLKYPLIIKPVKGANSAYVIKTTNIHELKEAIKYIERVKYQGLDQTFYDTSDVLIEEFLEGSEVNVDLLLQNGKIKFWSITDTVCGPLPFFLKVSHSTPSRLTIAEQRKIVEVVEETLELLGVMHGFIQFEIILTAKGAVPIEINLKLDGDEAYSFVKSAWGVDLIEGAVKIAVGDYFKPINKPPTPKKFLAGRSFLASHSGVISSLKLPRSVESGELNFFKKTGDIVLTPPDGFEILGFAYAIGDTIAEADLRLENIFEGVKLEVAKFTRASSLGKSTRKNNQFADFNNKQNITSLAKIARVRALPLAELRNLHVGIACNMLSNSESPVDQDLTSIGLEISKTLTARGYKTTFLDFNFPFKAAENIQSEKIDIVFNLCERINNSSLFEPHAASILDILCIPYTGSNPFTLSLCLDKIRSKKLLSFHKLPTPVWDYLYDLDDDFNDDFPLPAIVKPANTDNSIGITNDSVVTNRSDLKNRIEYIIKELKRPVLVEEFIEGDEFDVSILGSPGGKQIVLPLSRSIFKNLPTGYWHMFPYEAKFLGSEVHKKMIEVQRPPKGLSTKLTNLISEIALDAYNIFGCCDYGRIEVKVDNKGNPYILEVNPNPSIGPNDCVAEVAGLTGLDYGDFLEVILQNMILRYKNRPPFYHLQMSSL
jgi:D-alanine-D-alanine ligase